MSAVLLVTLFPPDHEGTGGVRREAYLIDALADKCEVDVVTFDEIADKDVIVRTRRIYQAAPPQLRRSRRLGQLRQLRALMRLGPPRSVQMHAPARRAIAAAVPDWSSYDVIWIDWPELVPLVRMRSNNAWILTYQYLESRQALQRAKVAPDFWASARARAAVRPMQPFERSTLEVFDAVFVTSPEDAAALGGRALLAPNGVDCDRFQPSPVPAEPKLVMTASLAYEPNSEAAIWFARNVFPVVKDRRPDARLELVGLDPPPKVLDLAGIPGITIHPNVPTVLPFLRDARVALAPLHVGSGTRLKALEAMAMGRPLVGTTVGLEGLGITDGVEAAIEDEPAAMGNRILELLQDDRIAEGMGAAGRQLVERSHCWSQVASPFVEKVVELAERRRLQPAGRAAR